MAREKTSRRNPQKDRQNSRDLLNLQQTSEKITLLHIETYVMCVFQNKKKSALTFNAL